MLLAELPSPPSLGDRVLGAVDVDVFAPRLNFVKESTESGILEGQVTIGPLQPVERPGFNPPAPPEVFTSRIIMVYDERGKSLIKEVSIEQTNQTNTSVYRVELPAGKYLVDINHTGIDHSSDVPTVVAIEPGQTSILNILIPA